MKSLALVLLASTLVFGQDDHLASVHEHGAQAMGFSQTATTHHFRLTNDGGVVEVTANDAKDAATQEKIRMHLQHIAQAFKAGDFSAPRETHQQTPPGAEDMMQLKDHINYKYEEIPAGGRVVISTNDAIALRAVHEFLSFQIEDHQTGDPVNVRSK